MLNVKVAAHLLSIVIDVGLTATLKSPTSTTNTSSLETPPVSALTLMKYVPVGVDAGMSAVMSATA
jgi:hypothetical protein